MANLVELRERMTARLNELNDLAQKAERTEEEEKRVDALLAEVNDLGPAIDREREIADKRAVLDALNQPAGERHSGKIAAEAEKRVVYKSPVERFVESQEYRAALSSARGNSAPVSVGSFRDRASAFFVEDGQVVNPSELRALMHSGTASASMLQPQVLPTIYRGNEQAAVVRDVLINASTSSDTIVVLQESGFTNAAAEVAEATAVDGSGLSGGVKPESAITFTEASFPVRWIAHWIPMTRQMLEDLPAMQSYVELRLRDGLTRREDNQLLNGDGSAPNIRGLLNTSGIQSLDAAYFTANPVVNAGEDVENLNRILRAKMRVMLTGGANATFCIVNPADYEKMLTIGNQNTTYMFGGPAAGNVATIWGLPVVQSERIAAGTALVGDGTMAAVFDRHDARLYTTDSHSDFFVRNILVMLAEERIALAVFRPVAFASVALAS